jgi:hypothetical protein
MARCFLENPERDFSRSGQERIDLVVQPDQVSDIPAISNDVQ